MTMKQIRIGDIGSFDNFDLYISKRNIEPPKKRIIKEEIPFKNGDYDFTSANGEPTFEEREISYTFDIVGASMEEVEAQKMAIIDWLMFAEDVDIYDDYINGYHFHGSFAEFDWKEDWEQSELTVTFSVYPYMIADEPTEQTETVITSKIVTVNNISSHAVIPTITTNKAIIVNIDGVNYEFSPTQSRNENCRLKKGVNQVSINNSATVTISYLAEVF